MAKLGSYIVDIGEIHLDWGIERAPGREREEGEGYIKIPLRNAKELELYNSTYLGKDKYGINLFYAEFVDGFKKNEVVTLKTTGHSGKESSNSIYAKNLQGLKDLKLIKEWFDYNKATTSNKVKVSIIEFDKIRLEII